MSKHFLCLHPSVESSSSVNAAPLRHSLFDAKDEFIERVAPIGMAAIYFGAFSLAPANAALSRQALFKLSFLHRHFLRPAGLHVRVDKEQIVFSGTLTSSRIVTLAEILAQQIEGLAEVVNEVELPVFKISNSEKARETIQLLFATDQTLGSGVQVNLHNDHLTLEGQVATAAQKGWAEQLVEAVAGEFDTNLKISHPVKLAHPATVKRAEVDDESLQALILLRLRLVNEAEYPSVRVKANRGIVSLQGKVRTEALRQRAENLTRSTLGLQELRSTLALAP